MSESLREVSSSSHSAPGQAFCPGRVPIASGPGRVAWLFWTAGGGDSDVERTRHAAGIFQAHSRFAVSVIDGASISDPKTALRGFDAVLAWGAMLEQPDCKAFCLEAGLPLIALEVHEIAEPLLPVLRYEGDLPRDGCTVARLDDWLEELLRKQGRWPQARMVCNEAARNVLILVPHRPKQDPRLGWMAAGVQGPLRVHQLGVHPVHSNDELEQAFDAHGGMVISVPTAIYHPAEAVLWGGRCGAAAGAQAAVAQLLWMERALALPESAYLEAVGAWRMSERAQVLRDYFRYFLNTSASLVREGSRLRGVDCIIAADLPTLPAALILGAVFRAKVVFDAHEYWPEADLGAADFEVAFWAKVERLLLPHTDLRFIVSTGLARMTESNCGVPVAVLPNAEPRSGELVEPRPKPTDVCHFLFQGGFARGRGIELLIDIWPEVIETAHLHLRGPVGEWRSRMISRAAATGLLDKRIFFPQPVDESELVDAAARAHVGLIPYEPHGANHQHCCPNKLSQYMAAGLPILANDTSFVSEVVRHANAGLIVDFNDRQALVNAVNLLAADLDTRERFARSSASYSFSTFNWEFVSQGFYEALGNLLAKVPLRHLQWFGQGRGMVDDLALNGGNIAGQAGMRLRTLLLRMGHAVWSRTPMLVQHRLKPLADRIWRHLHAY